ncbi:hypothetical protein ES706_04939 [subsurface metagenome]
MRIRIGNGLLPLNLLVWLLIVAIIFLPSNVLRIILGLPFILFFPGYALMAALFPKKEGIGSIERLTLSLAMSFVTVSLIGLIFNYTPWGIRLEPMLYSIASFIFVTSVIAWFRRRRLLWEERFGIEFHLVLPSWRMGIGDKALSIILVLAILGALGVAGYVIATPKAEDKFTDFYILGLQEQAADYPKELRVGEEGRVIVGIANHEYETVSYRIEVRINGTRNNEVKPIVLEHNEKWEEIVSFSLSEPGEDQKVEFFLYKNGEVEPCLKPLHLWVDVTQ